MKIVAIQPVWNEMDYLPLKIEWCKRNQIQPYVIDNLSDDGSWEWLQENNIPSHRFDTGGSFNLSKILKEIQRTIHEIKPDWTIFMGCDEFLVSSQPLVKIFEEYDNQGIKLVDVETVEFFNTREDRKIFDPFNTYFYSTYFDQRGQQLPAV